MSFKRKFWKRGDKLNAKELNRIEEGIASSNGGGGSELPEVTSADNGKVLGVVEGAWGKADAPNELPSVTSADNGKILGVVEGAWGKTDAPTELPAVTAASNGFALVVNNGAWATGQPKNVQAVSYVGTIDTTTGAVSLTGVTAYNLWLNAVGRPILAQLTIGSQDVYFYTWVSMQKLGSDYQFAILGPDGKNYITDSISAEDPVVFIPVPEQ